MPSTDNQAREALIERLERLDRGGVITAADKIELPGIHWCPDWDFLPVCDASPEIEGCTCPRRALEGK